MPVLNVISVLLAICYRADNDFPSSTWNKYNRSNYDYIIKNRHSELARSEFENQFEAELKAHWNNIKEEIELRGK